MFNLYIWISIYYQVINVGLSQAFFLVQQLWSGDWTMQKWPVIAHLACSIVPIAPIWVTITLKLVSNIRDENNIDTKNPISPSSPNKNICTSNTKNWTPTDEKMIVVATNDYIRFDSLKAEDIWVRLSTAWAIQEWTVKCLEFEL